MSQRLWESYPSSRQDSLSRGAHPNDLMRVNPKPHPLKRHTSDRSTELYRSDYQKRVQQQQKKPVHRTVSSNQITSRDTSRSSDFWRGDIPDGNHDYRPHPQSDQMSYNTKPSTGSLDRYSEGSQSSFTNSSSMEPTARTMLPPQVGGVNHTSYTRSSPASSQSDYSDHYINNSSSTGVGGGRYSSRGGHYHSLPRSRSSLTASELEERSSQRSFDYSSGVLIETGRVWPLEEENSTGLQPHHHHHHHSSGIPTVHSTDDYWLQRQIPPHYYPRSPTSPSFSSEGGGSNEQLPWYKEEVPDIHSGLYFPRALPPPPSQGGRPHSTYIQHYTPLSPPQDMPRPSSSAGKINSYNNVVNREQDRVLDVTEQKILSHQRLARYFNQASSGSGGEESPVGGVNHRNQIRRESSPADLRSQDQLRDQLRDHSHEHRQLEESYPSEGKKSPNKHKKVGRSKSGAFGKLVKKFSSKGKGDKPSNNASPLSSHSKNLSSSNSNLESFLKRVHRSHSMELLHLNGRTPVLGNGEARRVATPTPSPGATPKMGKGFFRARRNSETDLENFGALFRSGSKKNLLNDATEALYEAIEAEDEEKCITLLESSEVPPDLSSPNEDDWTPLDLACMLNERISVILLNHGAKDSTRYFKDPESRKDRVNELLIKAESERKSIAGMIQHNGGGSKEMDKQLVYWTSRVNLWRKVKSNIRKKGVPGAPRDVQLIISSYDSLTVKFSEPEFTNGAIVTRYKVQWSKKEQFVPEAGEFVLTDLRQKEYTIPGLENGEMYYVRVSAFNMKGFGPPRTSVPTYGIPSCWHEHNSTQPRYSGNTTQMEAIAANMTRVLSQQDSFNAPGTPSTSNSRKSIKKGITKLFNQGVKFHKSLKTGVYLASIVYSDDGRVLVTIDDNLPLVEVSDSHPSSIASDFAWLAKVACTWEDIQEMADVSENYTSSPAIQFRNRLLRAILMLQEGTGLQNLGLLHHHFYDAHGSLILVLVKYIEDYKSLQGVNTKWSSMEKLRRKTDQNRSDPKTDSSLDQLLFDVLNIMHYNNNCFYKLPKGLYLGYLKARVSSSIGSMTVVTSGILPNVLPYYRIRKNPNVSKAEWEWLQAIVHKKEAPRENNVECQSLQKTLPAAIEHFLKILKVYDKDNWYEETDYTQLYTEELIELNEDVTFLLLMPAPDQVCTPPGSTDSFEGPNFSHTPIATFELLQLYTYQRPFTFKFTEVSARLDIELLISQKKRREAFSKAEIAAAKTQYELLQKIHEDTEQTWKQMRWIETALKTARDLDIQKRLYVKELREIASRPQHQRMITTPSSSSLSSSTSSSAGALSPIRKSVSNVLSSRYIRVYPVYETGLAKGTSVKIFLTPQTTTDEVIVVTVEQLEKVRKEKGIPGRDIRGRDFTDFYLVASLYGHPEEVLPSNFTPLQLLNYSSKYKFIIRRWSLDHATTDV